MASTFRSHFRHATPKQDETSSQPQRKPSSRIPTKPDNSNTDNKQSKAAQHVSRLAKRASRSITPSDKTDYGTDKATRAPVPMTTVYRVPAASKRASVTQLSEVASAGGIAPSVSRHNHALPPPPTTRTPSLAPVSTLTTSESPRNAGLRRKPSTIERYAASKRDGTPTIGADSTTMHTRNDEFNGAFESSDLGISMPSTTSYGQKGPVSGVDLNQRLAPSVYTGDQPVTRYITPPVHNYAQSATPSTRYTDSPWSHVPTPSTASSYSPAIHSSNSTATPYLRYQSPTQNRPSIATRSNDKADASRLGLPPVRESSTSSSNSTLKPAERRPALPPKDDVPRNPERAQSITKAAETARPSSRGKLRKEKPRQPSTTSNAKPPVQIPPELAHLNVATPPKPSLNKALPPLRPTRDGTPTLNGMDAPSSVVQSDLPKLYTTYHKRTPSQETTSPMSPRFRTRFGLSPGKSSRDPSPRIDSAVSPPPASRTFTRDTAPVMSPPEGHRLARKDSPAVGSGPSPSKSPRFGLFSRKPKAEVPKTVEKPKRQASKGPAAGTGHEGYGRFGIRGRSGSSTSSNDFRSPSADSTTSSQKKRSSTGRKSSVVSKDGSDLDTEFLREHLSPVVVRGSGSTISNQESSPEMQAPSMPESSNHSSLDSLTKPQLLPSALSNDQAGMSPQKRPYLSYRAPSDSSEDDVTARYPTLAARRSLTCLSQGEPKSLMRMPAPIDTSRPARNPSIDSYDAENSAWPRTDSSIPPDGPADGREGLWLRPQTAEPDVKPSRKWSFFQRAQASPRNKGKEKVTDAMEAPNPASYQSPSRGVAHYAMLDPVEPVDLEEVTRIMQENETSAEDSVSEHHQPPKVVPYERRHKSLLPSPPKPEYLRDSDLKTKPALPKIMIRQDSSESPELLRAQPAIKQQLPQIVDIKRPPIEPEPGTEAASFDPSPELHSRADMRTPDLSHATLGTPEIQEGDGEGSPRQPRLSPIGRIPKVVSKRDRDRKLSDSSFSRPFARTQPRPTVKPPGSLYTQIRELASPIESGSQPVSSTSTRSDGVSGEQKSSINTNPPSVSTNRTSMDVHANEFFCFPARKDSDISYSSSSGNNSYLAHMAPQEEDVWHEYNDLLDEVREAMPGADRTPLSAGSSFGAPFQYSSELHEPTNYAAFPVPPTRHQPPTSALPQLPRLQTSVLSVPQQISRFMQPSMSPLATPQSLSDFVDHYGNRSTSTLITPNRTSIPGPKRTSLPQSTRSSIPVQNRSSVGQVSRSSLPSARLSTASSSRYSRSSGHSRSASLPEANARNSQSSLTPSMRFNRDTQLLDIAEVDGDEHAAAANLRFGALMTSKWLSFGRVLFSPAHNEMRLADEPRVLIIDGLGSDWSYYVALSYQAATVYNLGPSPTEWPGVTQQPPSNHRHINHAAISAGFPFPKGFFTAVVFRFPTATTEQAYQACISECKRVLRPGGYLEVAMLDLDLMNMGNKSRKAVRGLKTRTQSRDQNISLRNLSDFLVGLIGRKGFEEVQRCIVGVPAAGRIPKSQDMSSVSSGDNGKPIWQREDRHSQEFSFADLLEDARGGQFGGGKKNDESITKMVAKVGRWWYTSCYEKPLLQSDNSSIWNERSLLRECERQGTSFRLLICYAQKPTQTRRRTVSV